MENPERDFHYLEYEAKLIRVQKEICERVFCNEEIAGLEEVSRLRIEVDRLRVENADLMKRYSFLCCNIILISIIFSFI